jgi:hypothetical protein
MKFSSHSLHSSVLQSTAHAGEIRARLQAIADNERTVVARAATTGAEPTIEIPLTTVSVQCSFDSFIHIRFQGQPAGSVTQLIVDSGNSTLIVPSWDDIKDLPGYTVLGDGQEPFGFPAKIVKGPIEIPTTGGGVYTLEDCVFYACTGAPPGSQPTANFGAGRIVPWSADGSNTPPNLGVTIQAPLSYGTQYPFAEILFAPAATVGLGQSTPTVAPSSTLVLSQARPAGYSMLDIIPNLPWMALVPKNLSINGALTDWPGIAAAPIAMIDTGGGPVFLSDPNGYVYPKSWPQATTCPSWTSSSKDCNCVSAPITFELTNPSQSASYKFTVDTSHVPPTVQGLTLVMCRIAYYMFCEQGMNIGGISALFNRILIDYSTGQVGFKPI